MINVEFSVTDNGLIDAYVELCEDPESFVNVTVNRTMDSLSVDILEDFQQEPDAVKLPITFTTSRQRRFVMARKSGPYVRAHAISQGWKLQVVYTPGQLTSVYLQNDVPEAIFVEGIRQQPFMAVTGWLYTPDLADKWLPIIEDRIETDLIKAFYAVGDKR